MNSKDKNERLSLALKKNLKKRKLFQKKTKYKRYFVLDHNAKKMRVHQTNDPHSEYKLMSYSDIIDVRSEPMKAEEKRTI